MHQLVGHQENVERIRVAVQHDRLPSTFLFVGPHGIGKRKFAFELAKSLLCESVSDDPLSYCDQCEGCKLFNAGTHPDFHYLERLPGKAVLAVKQFIGDKKTGTRNKEGLYVDLMKTPFRGGWRIAVINDGDYFNKESANCSLKILEEPPPRSILIILGTSEQTILPTIRSRSQLIRFNLLTDEQVDKVLTQLDPEQIPDGGQRWVGLGNGSLSYLDLLNEEGLLEFREQLLKQLVSRDPHRGGFTKTLTEFVKSAGKEAALCRRRILQICDFSTQFYQRLLQRVSGFHDERRMDPIMEKAITAAEAAGGWTADAITNAIDCCIDLKRQVESNANQATMLETWLTDLGKVSRGESPYIELAPNY